MTVNRSSFDGDKNGGAISKKVQENGEASNGDGVHSIQLDTYFSEERVHIPDKVSV